MYEKVAFLMCNSGPDMMGSSTHWTGQKPTLYLPAVWVSVVYLHVACFLVTMEAPVSTPDPLCSKTSLPPKYKSYGFAFGSHVSDFPLFSTK